MTGVHGANRLASNSLLEGLVFGARSGQAMMKDAPAVKRNAASLPGVAAPKPGNSHPAASAKVNAKSATSTTLNAIRELMWKQVGIMRSGKELANAIGKLEQMELPKCDKPGRAEDELRNLHKLALLIARSGLAREESRGSHYRSDFAFRDDEKYQKHSLVQRGKEISFEK
jgi:L-aspartate oxidase